MNVVIDVIEALEAECICRVVNGHGRNTSALQVMLCEHVVHNARGEGVFVYLTNPFGTIPEEAVKNVEHLSDYAGKSETSCMFHLRPDLFREVGVRGVPDTELDYRRTGC